MNRSTDRVICVVGSINEDTTLRVRDLPGPGETLLARGKSVAHGGKGANQAAAAAAARASVVFVGAVGVDPAGAEALANLDRRGVCVADIAQLAAPTGTAVVVVDDAGENLIIVDPGANALLDPETVARAVEAANPALILAQLEVPIPALIAAASATSGTFLLNPAPMTSDPSEMAALLSRADIITPNRSELGRLAGRDEPRTLEDVDQCVAALSFQGTVVVTLGADGAAIYGEGQRVTVPPVAVDPVDTSGAGDVFCGVLAAELAAGTEVYDAVVTANAAAARSTTLPGAQVPSDFLIASPAPSSAG